jgi:hypothetical protein
MDQNTVVRCGSADAAAWGFVVQEGGDATIKYDHLTNSVVNATGGRLCSKRPQLVKTANSSKIYFVDYRFEAAVELAAETLHPLDSCVECGTNLCKTMELDVVDQSWVDSRSVGTNFDCSRLPGGRVVACSGVGNGRGAAVGKEEGEQVEGEDAGMYFQPDIGSNTVHSIPANMCAACPGALCINVVNLTASYCATLVPTSQFVCGMATGIETPPRSGNAAP